MTDTFEHGALKLQKRKPIIFAAHSKASFYFRAHISKFILEQGGVPINPFMSFDYFLTDSIDRDIVREANNNLVRISEELWVFGPIADGVLAEIQQAKKQEKSIRYFNIVKSRDIVETSSSDAIMEEGLEQYRGQL
ncbi:MAG: hypothetical protein COU35_03125 [Candidatus Magasanikbacteria bacterium CG10_big_fil_rev_8_21_14_0_10_47_10]|uniref:DUF7768 domain-containing protein n=1 Tax=Candidatus Magasanikbacteria bacterium CG10_big_fil_rev_8_21_14_0_10_47_10 TaxID=1974652 RepID=A0A2H0TQ46_9BACT|nr:MAG: hypothetical protein COU35_03125 [Candidatus Magasanikbacteria bacterium CG10_big_fil_rev_8_21_14_0_10_47_10]